MENLILPVQVRFLKTGAEMLESSLKNFAALVAFHFSNASTADIWTAAEFTFRLLKAKRAAIDCFTAIAPFS